MSVDIAQGVEEIAEDLGFGPGDSGEGESAASVAEGEASIPEGESAVTSKEEASLETDAAVDAATPAPAKVEDAAAQTEPAATVEPPPKTWRPDAIKTWDQIPPAARAEILKREEDMFKGLEGYKASANVGKALQDVVSPYLADFRAASADPMQVISGLLNTHMVLRKGTPEQRQAIFQKLAESYDVPLAAGGSAESPYFDPQVTDLKKTIDGLRERLDTQDQQTQESVRQKLSTEVDAFASDPKNVYFDEVAADVATILRSKVATTLQEAYDKAIWLNPVTRAKEQARLTAEAQAQTARETKEKAEAAKKAAAANVRKSAKSGSETAPTGDMDSTMKEALAEIKSRG